MFAVTYDPNGTNTFFRFPGREAHYSESNHSLDLWFGGHLLSAIKVLAGKDHRF